MEVNSALGVKVRKEKLNLLDLQSKQRGKFLLTADAENKEVSLGGVCPQR